VSKAQKSQKEMFQDLAAQFRRSARKPNIHGYSPHPKQRNFHASEAKIRALLGGNRSGKTVAGASEGVFYALGQHPFKEVPKPPTQGRIIGSDFVNSVEKILRPEFARWMPLSAIKGGSWEHGYDKEARVLTLENDSTVEFLSTDQELDKHAGASRSWIWFDEEFPYDYFVENKMRLLDQNGDMWMTLTPLEGMSGWLFDDIYSASLLPENQGIIESFVVEMEDNPYLALGEASALLAGLTKDEIEARKKGKFVQVGGLIYKEFEPEVNVIEPFIPPSEYLHFNGMDHGFNNPTCWLWAAVDKDGRMFVYDEHYESGKIVSYHAKVVNEKNLAHCEQARTNIMPAYSVGDPSIRNVDPITGTSVLLEYIEFGIPIVLGNNDVAAGINRVSRYIKDHEGITKLYITRNCVNLIWEMGRYRWGTWAQKKVARDKNKKEEPHKRNDHACDALRYMIASRPEVDSGTDVPPMQYPAGTSTAVNATGRIDEGLVNAGRRHEYDALEYD